MDGELQNNQFGGIPSPKPKRNVFIPILFSVFLFLAGFVAVLAARIWDPLWNPFRAKPAKVIEKMVSEGEGKLKTSEEKINLSIDVKSEEETKFNLKTEGVVDISNPQKPMREGKFDILVLVSGKGAPMGRGMKVALAGETRQLGEDSFLKLTTIPAAPFLALGGTGLPDIRNQWMKVDQESALNLMKLMSGEEWTPEMETIFEKQIKENKVLEKEFQKKLKKIISAGKFYVVKKEFPDDKINGAKTYHYLVYLDKNELSKAASEILKATEELTLKEYGFSPTFNGVETQKELNGFLDKVGEISGEMWIGKKNYILYKFKGEKTIDLSEFNEKGKFSIQWDFERSKVNKPVKIEAPSQYKNIEEILVPFINSYLETARMKARDAAIEANTEMLRDTAEMINVDFSYENLCYHSHLNGNIPTWGKDLMFTAKAIQQYQGGVLKLSCHSAKTSYCITTDLVSPGRGKYCIDSTGFGGEIGKTSECLGNGTSRNPYRCPREKKFLPTKPPKIEELPLKSPSLFQASILGNFLRLFEK